MYRRILWNDILRSRAVSLITLLFITASTLLISLASTLAVHLFGAINTLMTQASTPHFMQMHSGVLDLGRLEAFANNNREVEAFQVLEFLNIDGSKIVIGGNTLANSVQDNGLCTQSNSFDYLLDLEGRIIRPSDGELYVPIAYERDGTAKLGDKAFIAGRQFTVAGFLRDSQMNSLLASSKRFLISEKDYSGMRNFGTLEYLIEFRLNDPSALGTFESEYMGLGLEANGPTVTYPLFRMMNALSDGLMIALLLLMSALVVTIAFLCIRFTLLAKIEDDYREIGVMKAIGLPAADMKRLYLAKYGVLSGAGGALGYGLSFALKGMVLENIRLTMGESTSVPAAGVLEIAGVLLVFLGIMAYVNAVLGRFKHVSAVQALRFGTAQENARGTKGLSLSRNRLVNTNIVLGIKDVMSRKSLYATMLAVIIASTFIVLVPQNLYQTLSSPDFSTYMGIGKCDILIGIQTGETYNNMEDISQFLENDRDVAKYAAFTTKRFTVRTETGIEEQIRIELGSHTVFPVSYSKGRAPQTENEIALSSINAGELDKQVGDTLVLIRNGEEKKLKVCGIYSDITNGGKTAKASFADSEGDVLWSTICVKFSQNAFIEGKAAFYAEKFNNTKISYINEYITQTFGPTIRSIQKTAFAGMLVALTITLLITLLMMKMLIAKERYSIAVMKAIGFTGRDISAQFLSRFLFVLLAGIVSGTILANTLGEWLAGAVIGSFGATSFQFDINPLSAFLLFPLAMGMAVLFGAMLGGSGVQKIKISRHLKE